MPRPKKEEAERAGTIKNARLTPGEVETLNAVLAHRTAEIQRAGPARPVTFVDWIRWHLHHDAEAFGITTARSPPAAPAPKTKARTAKR